MATDGDHREAGRVDVQAILDKESAAANAVSLTQATQFSAGDRVIERGRVRQVILALPLPDVLQARRQSGLCVENRILGPVHIRECDMDGSAVKRFCLLLYAPSHLLPSDTADDISRLRSVLEQFLLAVLKRTSTLEMEGPSHWVEMLFRVSRSALEACSAESLFQVMQLAIDSVRSASPGVKDMLSIFSVALSHMLTRRALDHQRVLRRAQVQEVLQTLFATPWPAALIAPVLKSLRASGLQKESALFPAAESAQQAASIVAAGRNACASVTIADSECLPDAVESLLHIAQPLTLQHVRLVCGVVGGWLQHAGAGGAAGGAEEAMLARVTDALMHNHGLANQWVKSFRGDAAPSRFDVAVALMLCRGPRSATAQQKTVDALKASVTACLQHEQALKSSQWASELQHTPHRSTRCAAVLLHGLAQSQNGGLASQLVAFAQHLLAAHTVKGVMLSHVPYAEEEDYTGLVWWACDAPHNSCLSLAGAAILEQVAHYHPVRICAILEHVCAQLVACAAVEGCLQYLVALHSICSQHADALAVHPETVQVMLDGLLAGNSEVSVAALCILWPLCCHMQSQSLRKVVVSHLRHAQRLPDVASRVAGVQGFLMMIIHSVYGGGAAAGAGSQADPLSVSWSQLDPMLATQTCASMSQLPGVTAEGASLLADFAGFLRRPMLQQAPVRKALYDGLHALAADKDCAQCIFNILSPSLQKHVTVKEGSERKYQLHLEGTAKLDVGAVGVKDALPELLACVLQTIMRCKENVGGSVDKVVQVTDCIFLQLATYSLEELRIERPESVSWRDPEGFHFQAQAYTLLGVYDLVCSHFAESLADPELTTAAAEYIAHAIDCQGRLQTWLSAATRTKRLKDVTSDKLSAPATAEELAMVPPDPKSRVSFATPDALMCCAEHVKSLGDGYLPPEVEGAFLNPGFLQWVFASGASQLAHAAAVHRSNANIAAVWAPTPEVQRCCEGMLRIPDWRPLVRPLMLACCNVVSKVVSTCSQGGHDEEACEDLRTVVNAAVPCMCTVLELTSMHGYLFELLAGLPDSEDEQPRALQGTTAEQVTGCSSGAAYEAARRLPALYDVLAALLRSKCMEQVAEVCGALRRLPLPTGFMHCIARWPLSLAAQHEAEMAAVGTTPATAESVLQLAMQSQRSMQDDLLRHTVHASMLLRPRGVGEAEAMSNRNEEVHKLCSSIMTTKSEAVLLKHVLGCIAEGCESVCWLCKQLQDLLRCSQLQPDEAVRALALEKAASQRIELFGGMMTDICYVCGDLFADINCSIVVCVHKACLELMKAADCLVRALLVPKQRAAEPSKAALAAFAVVNLRLTPSIYDLHICKLKGGEADAPAEKKQKTEKREAARAKKEASICPEVVFQIEQFQADCGKLDKLAGCRITKKIARTIARDIKITAK